MTSTKEKPREKMVKTPPLRRGRLSNHLRGARRRRMSPVLERFVRDELKLRRNPIWDREADGDSLAEERRLPLESWVLEWK